MELNNRMLALLLIIRLTSNNFDEVFDNIEVEDNNITIAIDPIFENIINFIQEQSTENFIDRSITTGANIDAYKGLSSRFNNFIRGAINPENNNDEENLDKINEKLMELEKIDRNNIPKIMKIYSNIINNISSLSVEAKNDMFQAFTMQNTIEEKMNESFPQIGTIMLYSLAIKNNKSLFSENDIKILSKITEDIELLNDKKYYGELTKNAIIDNLHNSFLKATPYMQEIFFGIIINNPQYFENMEKEIGVSFDEIISNYELPIQR